MGLSSARIRIEIETAGYVRLLYFLYIEDLTTRQYIIHYSSGCVSRIRLSKRFNIFAKQVFSVALNKILSQQYDLYCALWSSNGIRKSTCVDLEMTSHLFINRSTSVRQIIAPAQLRKQISRHGVFFIRTIEA